MATRHSTSIPAVGYLRRSTSKQEKSLDDQRREIERYAAEHGYTIVRWFQDDGISGDNTDKRAGFQAMHKAACNGRDFDCIIVWDSDRFGRFNSIEGGYWIHPLMRAGVKLVTVTEGPIDWTGFAGRIVNAVKQEGKHQYLVDLSRNVARGQITTALNGWLTGQRAPYGFDRMLVDESGTHRQRVASGEQVAKPRAWHVTLVPSEDPEKLSTLGWLFSTFANRDISLRSLAGELNAKGIPGPTGGPWYAATIRATLAHEAYVGTFCWPKRRSGKYNRVALDSVKQRDRSELTLGGQTAVLHNLREEQIVKPDCWPALIDQNTFDVVQAKIHKRRRSASGQGYRTHTSGNGDAYLLSGLLVCHACGRPMHGRRGDRYVCSTYTRCGSGSCQRFIIDQNSLVGALLHKLREQVLVGGSMDKLRAKVRKQLAAAAPKLDASRLVELRRSVADLERDLDAGTKRLLRCPDDVADLLAAELAGIRKQRDRLAAELVGQQRFEGIDLDTEADAVVDRLWRLDQELSTADPARLRELLGRMVQRIELHFHQDRTFLQGEVTLHPSNVCCVNHAPP